MNNAIHPTPKGAGFPLMYCNQKKTSYERGTVYFFTLFFYYLCSNMSLETPHTGHT